MGVVIPAFQIVAYLHEIPDPPVSYGQFWAVYDSSGTSVLRRGLITDNSGTPALTWETAEITGFLGNSETFTAIKSQPGVDTTVYVASYKSSGGDAVRLYKYDGSSLDLVFNLSPSVWFVGIDGMYVERTGEVWLAVGKNRADNGAGPVGDGNMGIYYSLDGESFAFVSVGANGSWGPTGCPSAVGVDELTGRVWTIHTLISPTPNPLGERCIISFSDNGGLNWTDVIHTAINNPYAVGGGTLNVYPADGGDLIIYSSYSDQLESYMGSVDGLTGLVVTASQTMGATFRQGIAFYSDTDIRIAFPTQVSPSSAPVRRSINGGASWADIDAVNVSVNPNGFSILQVADWAMYVSVVDADLRVSLDAGVTFSLVAIPGSSNYLADWVQN